MTQAKRIDTESPFGFKNKSSQDVFKNVVIRVCAAIKDCEKHLKPGEKIELKTIELQLEVDKPKRRKKKK